MTRYRVLPYKQGSRSAKLLSETLGGKVLKLEGSKYKRKPDDVVINWGNSGGVLKNRPVPTHGNDPFWVGVGSNKLTFFQRMAEEHADIIPRFWTDKADIPLEAFPVVCRTVLNGHSGQGIVIANTPEEAPEAPLYTQYIKKKGEYRVHVVKGRVIFVQRKARKLDVAEPDWRVRNLAGGFVFCLAELEEVPESVLEQSIITVETLGLDFGACDVIWNEHEQKSYVLEVNCAPGLEPRSAEFYANAFKEL